MAVSLKRASLLFLVLALAVPVAVSAAKDVIYKADGSRLRGEIVEENRHAVTIETYGGTFTVPRDRIARIEREGDVFREFQEREDGLSRHDAAGWFELGQWAQDQDLHPQAIDCFHQVIRIEPDHEEARWELGYRRLHGEWVTEKEYYRARGYVQYEGRWVTPGEKENLEQGLVLVDGHWVPRSELEEEEAERAEREAYARRERERDEGARERSRGADDERSGDEGAAAGGDPGGRPGRGKWRPQGGQVGQEPLSPEERERRLEEQRKAGGWEVAFASEYYDFFSNGPRKQVRRLAFMMDLMCEEYVRIFKFEHELTRPFPVHLYGSQKEFMRETGQGPGTGGFYDGEKIVAFHGSVGNLDTLSVLFHEGTHQFQGLVMGQNMWKAQIWLIEGLAVFFEASEAAGRRLRTGIIPKGRLMNVKRAIRSGRFVHLRDLIRMEQARFGALHYAHAWSLIYFLVNGTEGGKERFVQYWEEVKRGHEDQVALFEEIFDRPMDEIEAAWKDYVLHLDARGG